MRYRFLVPLFCLFMTLSCDGFEVVYPFYPRTPEGRELKRFLTGVQTVGLAVDPGRPETWKEDFAQVTPFLRIAPAKIFEAFSADSYFKVIDLSKRADIINEANLSLAGITQSRMNIGSLLGAEAILYVTINRPSSECSTELRPDYFAMGIAVLQIAAASRSKNKRHRTAPSPPQDPILKPTGVRRILLPIEASLVRVDTGETKMAVISKPFENYNGAGNTNCPSLMESLSEALEDAIPEIKSKLSPKMRTERLTLFVESDNAEVKNLLEEGYEELQGDTPSFRRAKIAWEKADQKAEGKSWAAKANLGTYYFSQGDFEKARELYEEAYRIGGPKKNYLNDLNRKAAYAAEAIE